MMTSQMAQAEENVRQIESLKQDLARAESPANRLHLLVEIGTALAPVSLNEARVFIDQAIRLARNTKDCEALARSGRLMAEACSEAGETASGLEYATCVREAGEATGSLRLQGSYFYICGEIHEARGDYTQSQRCYETARGLWQEEGFVPGEMSVLNQLGNLSGLMGKANEALAYYQDALRLADELNDRLSQASCGFNVGWALQQLGRWEDAVESFYRVLAIKDVPDIADLHCSVYSCLGVLFLRRDKPIKAVDMFKKVLDMPRASPSNLRDTWTNIGEAYQRMADFAGASEAFDRALQLSEKAGSLHDVAVTRGLMAELALAQGGLDRAWQLNEQALSSTRELGLRREQGLALRVRALILAARGETDAAARAFDLAVALLQDAEDSYELAQVRFSYGRFLLNEGRRDAATGLLKAAARVFRKLSVVAEAEEINRLLFRQEMQGDSDVALLQGISGLVPMGLEPPVFLEQSLKLLREALRFDSAAVLFRGRPILVQGKPNLAQARTFSLRADSTGTPTALSWPVQCGGAQCGRIYLERAAPIESEHSPLILDTIANLLASAIQRTAETAFKAVEGQPDLAALRYRGVVGHNSEMLKTLGTVCRVADTDVPVLIRGESGTGKELIARALHESGPRASGPFVAVNCAALPENLLEAEFFGIEKGAATGVTARRGKFEAAHGGTVFLDEIGDMSPALQAKLLRVLQDRVVERVGGVEPIQVDVRIVAATNQDLEQLMQSGAFRSDLYYRLNTVELHIPALRERADDIPDLVRHLTAVSNQEFGRSITGVSFEVLRQFTRYRWPGNIRELQHTIERAVILARGELIEAADLPAEISSAAGTPETPAAGGIRSRRREAETAAGASTEKAAILECLAKADWNVSKAAGIAGYSRAQFYRLMIKHGVTRRRD